MLDVNAVYLVQSSITVNTVAYRTDCMAYYFWQEFGPKSRKSSLCNTGESEVFPDAKFFVMHRFHTII